MSNTCFISDLHLDHPKALQVRGWFPTLKEYQEYVCDIWVDKVTPRTTIYLLGDIAFTWEGLGILKKLPGKKLEGTLFLSYSKYLMLLIKVNSVRFFLMREITVKPTCCYRQNFVGLF